MCGHFGILGPGIQQQDLDILEDGARVSIVRGKDGSGVLQGRIDVKAGKENLIYTVDKSEAEINTLIHYHQNNKNANKFLLNTVWDDFFCVHVRAATRGGLSWENSHPFDLDDIVGMHNGTLVDHKYIPKNGETDSLKMFEEIDTVGPEDVLKNLDKQSAYAIVMLDKNTKELVFARNDKRPLCFAVNSERSVMYYASEAGMLRWLLERYGVKFDHIYYFKTDMIYRVRPDKIEKNWVPWKTKDLMHYHEAYKVHAREKPKYDHIKNALVPKVVEYKPGPKEDPQSPLIEQQKAKEKAKETVKAKVEKPKNTADLLGFGRFLPKKPEGVVCMPRASLHRRCRACQKDMDLYDQGKGRRLKSNEFLCRDCDTPELVHFYETGFLQGQSWN